MTAHGVSIFAFVSASFVSAMAGVLQSPDLEAALALVQTRMTKPVALVQTAMKRQQVHREWGERADWNDKNIVLDGLDKSWRHIPTAVFQAGSPFPPQQNLSDAAVQSGVSITVLIAALQEARLVHTLESMFDTADHPARVYVGIVQQNTASDEDAIEAYCRHLGTPLKLRPEFVGKAGLHRRQPGEDDWGQRRFTPESLAACGPAARVRTYRMDREEAAGPVYARAQQRRLLRQGADMEDFCLQLDGHSVFTRGWDTKLLDQFKLTENEYAVLTTYPTNAATLQQDGSYPNVNGHWEMPHLCEATVEGPGVVRNSQASAVANLDRPLLSKLWAAGLSFSRCHAERDVPADPKLKQIFTGEEFSRGARLWTNGYDFYSLSRPVVGVYYGGEKHNAESWHQVPGERLESEKRLEQLLGQRGAGSDPEALRGFDLGTRRRLQDYITLTGVNATSGVAKRTPCAVQRWTPWQPGAPAPYQALAAVPMPL